MVGKARWTAFKCAVDNIPLILQNSSSSSELFKTTGGILPAIARSLLMAGSLRTVLILTQERGSL